MTARDAVREQWRDVLAVASLCFGVAGLYLTWWIGNAPETAWVAVPFGIGAALLAAYGGLWVVAQWAASSDGRAPQAEITDDELRDISEEHLWLRGAAATDYPGERACALTVLLLAAQEIEMGGSSCSPQDRGARQ